MAELDFKKLWGNTTPPNHKGTPKEQAPDSNEYTAIKKEYQQYITFNKGLDQQRKEANKGMTKLLKDCSEGKPSELLEDSLKIIGVAMRDTAFYEQTMDRLKDNPHTKAE